ncbi:MAG TPA: hypothetical protein VJH34_00400 [archaeon]|nr:hypothetical protein [archaeon]
MEKAYYGSRVPEKPYIGMTGIENVSQLDMILSTYKNNAGNLPHQLMMGALVSYKSLARLKEDETVLLPAEIEAIFDRLYKMKSDNVLLALHYFTKPPEKVDEKYREKVKDIVEASLSRQIGMLTNDLYQKYTRVQMPFEFGVQTNVSWPDVADFNWIRGSRPRMKTIFQISDFTKIEDANNYDATYFLIDASKGRGIGMDVDKSAEIYKLLQPTGKPIVFAGGLSPENVGERISQLYNKLGTTNFSIDAESSLRTNDRLDLDKVDKYIVEATSAFKQLKNK